MKRKLANQNFGYLALVIVIVLAQMVETPYYIHIKDMVLQSKEQGLTEHKLCQMAYDAFGIEMVEEIDCSESVKQALEY